MPTSNPPNPDRRKRHQNGASPPPKRLANTHPPNVFPGSRLRRAAAAGSLFFVGASDHHINQHQHVIILTIYHYIYSHPQIFSLQIYYFDSTLGDEDGTTNTQQINNIDTLYIFTSSRTHHHPNLKLTKPDFGSQSAYILSRGLTPQSATSRTLGL